MIHIGVAGWSYPDWQGKVYPADQGRRFDALRYLARYVDAIEVNSSFYRTPASTTTASWVKRLHDRPGFRLTAKIHRRFTHDREGTEASWRSEADALRESMAPLLESGMLGALLMQFPYSFRRTPEAVAHVERVARELAAYPVVLEVRHSSWLGTDVLEWLDRLGVGFCNVDQPRIGSSVSGTAHALGPVGYVRLHGRNYRDWFREGAGRDARYDYLYDHEELAGWAGKIRSVARATRETYVIANNHFEGKALVNALELMALLDGKRVEVPDDLLRAYPRLASVSREAPAQGPIQGNLFS